MGHVSHRLKGSIEGALAGGGDPATSPLYVFGPFLRILAGTGAGAVCFGASIWMVVATVCVVGMMYRNVMRWVPDGSGGSGLCEEEFGGWAVKVNAAITAIEYTLTWLVSVAALVTFIADRSDGLDRWARAGIAVVFTAGIAFIVNRGPRLAARVFGPATAAVLLLLWILVGAVVFERGLQLPTVSRDAFVRENLNLTLGGYVRLLALMTGIEVFANLVAAYEGPPAARARKAFGSLLIVMVTTLVTMVIVGPAIYELADANRTDVSVFTQTMDHLLPSPVAYAGTLVGIVVLLSAAAASAQGLQNLALGLRHRHYIPARFGQRNRFDVADRPVLLQALVVAGCFIAFGTHEETYLALYAAGVFVLLGLTGWASVKRLWTRRRVDGQWITLPGTVVAAMLTSAAAVLIFTERFVEGAWVYLALVPALYIAFSRYRSRLGRPSPVDERLGRVLAEQKSFVTSNTDWPRSLLVVIDGSAAGETALVAQAALSEKLSCVSHLCCVRIEGGEAYVATIDRAFSFASRARTIERASDAHAIARDDGADLLVVARELEGARELCRGARIPVLVVTARAEAQSRYPRLARIIVGLDGSLAAESSLPYALRLQSAGATIHLLAVPDGDVSTATLREYVERVARDLRATGDVEVEVSGSGPARTFIESAVAASADLVVVASHGTGGTARAHHVPLGSVPERLLSELDCPLLIIPATEVDPKSSGVGRSAKVLS